MTTRNHNKALTLLLVGAASLATALSSAAYAADRGFTFAKAEYMDPDRAQAEAQAFLAAHAPAGTPIAQAVAALKTADMGCHTVSPDGSAVCSFSMPVGSDGGTLGEDIWTVRLTDPDGQVTNVQLGHERTGFAP